MRNNSKSSPGIWMAFYKNNSKPMTKEAFINELKNEERQKYILLDGMENFVKSKLSRSLTKTQMRNIFKLITDEKDPIKLQIRLTYIAGKSDKWDVKNFIRLLIDIYKDDANTAKTFIESALAYHKFHAQN